MNQHFSDTLDSRGSNVEFNQTITDEQIDLPIIPDPTGSGRPSVGNIREFINKRVPGADGDAPLELLDD